MFPTVSFCMVVKHFCVFMIWESRNTAMPVQITTFCFERQAYDRLKVTMKLKPISCDNELVIGKKDTKHKVIYFDHYSTLILVKDVTKSAWAML